MPPHPVAAEQARTITERSLHGWDLVHLKDNALLVVSELVTNAVKQCDVFRFTLCRAGERALVEVTDAGPGNPVVKKADETDVYGRGLFLVEAVSDEWGVRYGADGEKTVWAIISK